MTEVPPILLSAMICERVIFDRITGMASLINVVHSINSPKYPMRSYLVFFCELTNGHGKAQTRIRIVDTQQEDKVIFEQHGQVEFKDVRQVVTLGVNLQGIGFTKPGEYRFQIFAEDQLLGERRLTCRQVKPRGKPGGEAGRQ